MASIILLFQYPCNCTLIVHTFTSYVAANVMLRLIASSRQPLLADEIGEIREQLIMRYLFFS